MARNPVNNYDRVLDSVKGVCPNEEDDWLVSPVYDERIEKAWICPICGMVLGDSEDEAIEAFERHAILEEDIPGDYQE